MPANTLPQVLVSDALRDIETTIQRFRSMYPPPYLDRSTAGLAYTALTECRSTLQGLKEEDNAS